MSKFVLTPTLLAAVTFACTNNQGSDLPDTATDVRISASIPSDLDGLSAVRLELTPAQTCEGFWTDADDEGIAPHTEDLDVTRMVWPNGAPVVDGPNEYGYWLAEAAFIDVVPGCYDVLAIPLGSDGEPLVNCHGTRVPINVDSYTSTVVVPPVFCSEPPREQLDVLASNFAPHIDELTVDPAVSACEAAKVCATARDADFDMLVFDWPQPDGIDQGAVVPWPTVVEHHVNADRSVTQCIRVQAHEPGMYDITVIVYDVVRPTLYDLPTRIEEIGEAASHASASVTLDATLGCDPTGRSAVILLTLSNDPGLNIDDSRTLIGNTVRWAAEPVTAAPAVLVVLDDNHHGENWMDGQFVQARLGELGISADYLLEPMNGLTPDLLEGYDVVWFVNPGYEVDDADTHTTLLRYRQQGGAVVLQGDDIARFRSNPQFMEPLTYLSWQGNGTVACGATIDNNVGDNYIVEMLPDASQAHPIMMGLQGLRFKYGNDIDLTRALGQGEQVLAWATYETDGCEVRTPVVVALEPDTLLPW